MGRRGTLGSGRPFKDGCGRMSRIDSGLVTKEDVLAAVEITFRKYGMKWSPNDKNDGLAGAVPQAIKEIPNIEDMVEDIPPMIEKEYSKTYLMKWTRKELIDHIMMLARNNNILHEQINQQYIDFQKLLKEAKQKSE